MGFVALHREMIRAAERALNQQLHAAEELDDKSEQMIPLAVGTMGAEVAAFGFVADRAHPPATAQAILGVAFILAFAALASFLDAYVGKRYALSLLEGYASYFTSNARLMAVSSASRRIGLGLLAASTVLAGATDLYPLAGRVIG